VIRALPRLLVDQIAAGEVIERPASVVKELVENALDAGARRIEVFLEAGGRNLIRVTDDGSGIAPEDLPLAVAPHATSKIAALEDLEQVATLGFRGEALASIAAIAELELLSRPAGALEGAMLTARGGTASELRPAAAPPGTSVTVRNLFWNTPARRKFLKSDAAEAAAAAETLARLALAQADVEFALTVDGKPVHRLPAGRALEERFAGLYGAATIRQRIAIDAAAPGVEVRGFLGHPTVARPNARLLHLTLNGRPIRDRALAHAAREGYGALLMSGRHPLGALQWTVAAREVDVNVHPQKLEVRFREPSRVYGLTVNAVRRALSGADLVAEGLTAPPPPAAAQGPWPPRGNAGLGPPSPAVVGEASPAAAFEPRPLAPDSGTPAPFQLLRTYLFQEAGDEVRVTDQHALHERVLYEEARERLRRGGLAAQQLLVPVVVELSAEEKALALEEAARLGRLGFVVEDFGGNAVALRALPALYHGRDGAGLLVGMLEALAAQEVRTDPDRFLERAAATIACRAAVKAGDRLSVEEMEALLRRGEAVARSPYCPHGRPATIRVPRDELDRWFRR
jgi:DNA mismatch repair protein MutL